MVRPTYLLCILILGIGWGMPFPPSTIAHSATPSPPDTSTTSFSWYVLPNGYYTPETNVGGGVASGFFWDRPSQPTSSLLADASVTLEGQYQFNTSIEWFRDARWRRIKGEVSLQSFPSSFFGVGPRTPSDQEEDFTSRFVDVDTQIEWHATSNWRAGIRLRGRHDVFTKTTDGGLLDTEQVAGHDGSTVLGAGPVLVYDTRNAIYYPQRGRLLTAQAVVYPSGLGTTHGFTHVAANARQYVSLHGNQTLALQTYAEAIAGTAPFTVLPKLGGSMRMRGYRDGRFRDNVYVMTQAEWRIPLFWRVETAAFAGLGTVAPRVGDVTSHPPEWGIGTGLRYRLNDAGVRVRVDYAIGREGTGLYMTASQPL